MPNDTEDYIGGRLTLGSIVYRDPAVNVPDFDQDDLTLDSLVHELDFSSFVPAGALAILLHCEGYSASSWSMLLSKKGDILMKSAFPLVGNVSEGVASETFPVIFCGSDRVIDYLGQSVISLLRLTVVGWFT